MGADRVDPREAHLDFGIRGSGDSWGPHRAARDDSMGPSGSARLPPRSPTPFERGRDCARDLRRSIRNRPARGGLPLGPRTLAGAAIPGGLPKDDSEILGSCPVRPWGYL